jgi:hypothetical protein
LARHLPGRVRRRPVDTVGRHSGCLNLGRVRSRAFWDCSTVRSLRGLTLKLESGPVDWGTCLRRVVIAGGRSTEGTLSIRADAKCVECQSVLRRKAPEKVRRAVWLGAFSAVRIYTADCAELSAFGPLEHGNSEFGDCLAVLSV